MATQVQFRGGTTSEHSTFTGVAREVTVDTTKKTVVVHDGSTAGGIPLAKESAVTSAAAITGGSINGTTVGASTASTGAFTTLSASSTVSGAGFSTYLASPPAIGGTTASTGRFTTVTATGLTSGRVTYAGASGLLTDNANFVFTGTTLGIGTASPVAKLDVYGGAANTSISVRTDSFDGTYYAGLDFSTGGQGANYPQAQIKAVGANNYSANLIFSTQNSGTTNPLGERMRITSAGNVGIGTSSPNVKLQVNDTTGELVRFNGTTTGTQYVLITNNNSTGEGLKLAYTNSDGSASLGTVYTAPLSFITGNTPKMTILDSGLVGIGTSSPGTKISILATNAPSPTIGTASGGFSLLGTDGLYGLYSGVSDSGNSWLQAMRNNSAISYNLLLQPSGGNVGIGTSSPSSQLQVKGTDVKLTFETSSGASSYIQQLSASPYNVSFFNQNSGSLIFGTNDTERMRIDSSGNLLVGTTDTTKTNTGFRVESGVANTSRGSTGSFFEFYDTGSGSRIGYISNSGGVATLYNTTSDQRLKTNIVDAPSGNIDSIKVRSFDWIVNNSHQPYGMVAQELIEVAPYAVNKPENPDEMMAVDYSKLVPMMIKEIQDLKARLLTLENK